MSTPRQLAIELAIISVVMDRAKEIKDELRAQLLETLETVGADSAAAQLPDGTKIAKVGIVASKDKPSILNEQAFTAHVEKERPDEIVKRIREGFKKAYLETLRPTDEGEAFDPATGEIVPGVIFSQSTAYPTLRFEKEGRAIIISQLSSGELSLQLTPTTREITN